MPRKPRKLSATGIYHIMTRGIDRMAIFHDDEDREKYLEILADCLPGEQNEFEDGSLVPTSCDKGDRPQPGNCPDRLSDGDGFSCHTERGTEEPSSARILQPIPTLLYNYCLMGNHVHLLLKTGSEPLSHLMKRICVRYAAFFKWKYHRTGHLFQDRFRSEPVEDKAYLLAVYRYITLNPVKAGLCEKPGTYPWCGVTSQNIGDDSSCHTEGGAEELSSAQSLELTSLPVALTRDEIWDYICADMPEIHPFAERVLDGEAKDLLLRYGNLQNSLEVVRLPRNEQIILFARLQEEGVSIQQMARLTGIAKTNIARWLS